MYVLVLSQFCMHLGQIGLLLKIFILNHNALVILENLCFLMRMLKYVLIEQEAKVAAKLVIGCSEHTI